MTDFEVVTVPLENNELGVIRVAGTRVTLDSVMHAYHEGATAEEIVLRFPTCTIGDIYTILSWAINNPAVVEAYLAEQSTKRDTVERELRQRYPTRGLRERLLARAA